MRTLLFTECVDLVGTACKPFDGTKRYVSTGAVDVDHINGADTEIVDYEGKPSRANLEVAAGDILFAKMQGTRKTLLIDSLLAENVYSTGFCAVRAKDGILTDRCLYYLLTSEAFLSQKDKNCSGATQKAISNAGLGKIRIQVPNNIEQDAVADRLDALAAIIGKCRQELASLDDLVKSRFVEMFGTNSEPKYDVVHVDQLCSAIVDCPHETPKYEGVLTHPAIRTSELLGTQIAWETMKYVSDEEYALRIKRLKPLPGDVVYAREGTYGTAAVLPEGYEFCLGQRTMLFRPDETKCTSEYLLYALTSVDVKRQADELNVGATVPHVNVKDAKMFKMPLPPLSLQQEFASFASQVDKSRSAVQRSIEQLELLKASLMQEYFG